MTIVRWAGFGLGAAVLLAFLGMPQATIYVENVTTGDLYLVGPCGNAVSPQGGTILGFMDSLVSGGPNELKGSTCNAVRLPHGQLFEVQVRIELAPGLAAGDYAFQTVFEVVNQVAIPPPTGMVSWCRATPTATTS